MKQLVTDLAVRSLPLQRHNSKGFLGMSEDKVVFGHWKENRRGTQSAPPKARTDGVVKSGSSVIVSSDPS